MLFTSSHNKFKHKNTNPGILIKYIAATFIIY